MNYNNLTDIELVKQCLLGDEAAWDCIMDRYWWKLFGTCKKKFGDLEKSEINDALIDAFGNAIEAILEEKFDIEGCRYDKENRFFSWLYTIAHNECHKLVKPPKIQRYAVSINQPVSQEEGEDITFEDVLSDPSDLQDSKYEKKEIWIIVNKCIDGFSDEMSRKILSLRLLENLNLNQISKILDIKYTTLTNKYNRVMGLFKRCLKSKGLDFNDDLE